MPVKSKEHKLVNRLKKMGVIKKSAHIQKQKHQTQKQSNQKQKQTQIVNIHLGKSSGKSKRSSTAPAKQGGGGSGHQQVAQYIAALAHTTSQVSHVRASDEKAAREALQQKTFKQELPMGIKTEPIYIKDEPTYEPMYKPNPEEYRPTYEQPSYTKWEEVVKPRKMKDLTGIRQSGMGTEEEQEMNLIRHTIPSATTSLLGDPPFNYEDSDGIVEPMGNFIPQISAGVEEAIAISVRGRTAVKEPAAAAPTPIAAAGGGIRQIEKQSPQPPELLLATPQAPQAPPKPRKYTQRRKADDPTLLAEKAARAEKAAARKQAMI